MGEHLGRRWGLRLVLVVLALFLAWSQWTDDPAVNLFLGLWATAAVIGTLGSTLSGPSASEGDGRTSRLPHGLQGLLVGLVLGALAVLLAQGEAPIAAGGLVIALVAVYDDLLRASWNELRAA